MDFNFDFCVYFLTALIPEEFVVSVFYSKLYHEEFAQNPLVAVSGVESYRTECLRILFT